MSQDGFLSVRSIAGAYGATRVLEDINLEIARGEFVALLGSSGCGKTTLLRTIAGFISPTAGSISVAGKDVTRLPPDKRGMALVFQSYALWPHMTVAQNIGYGLKLRGMPRAEIGARVSAMETLLGLDGLGARKPAALSGGQRQRVALGRALAIDPEILLLDEPLSNLDARIRLTVRHELRALQKRLGITAIHVTHDREEAMVMADRIVILDAGRIAQQGAPEEVYNRPTSAFVAAFMGAENVLSLSGAPRGENFVIAAGPANAPGTVPLMGRRLVAGAVEARFRPEAAQLFSAATPVVGPGITFLGEVTAVSYPGGHWRHSVRLAAHEIMADASRAFEPGEAVQVHVAPEALFLFSSPDQTPAPAISRSATGKVHA
ncbi:ABC transporter ATP-binding protein [Rhizobiaceae bacterium n13]|uniref:ABC transporter ATP-binding protein n=1 Tax=Ferirhizobium litorale TaxID=2927786 RepID=A0AAE3QJL5_9HYPH|nr:ABC transporter ATP-binding protein [Fererhizobium litorale]MDI7864509.1 ABC transporter ATP-binding protein [Fererhizobium litorale]MDI7924740.1 ABC transporter ATP-binding protein [Fererhizobium litorale]